jgi:hypothetical protein
MSRKGEFRQFHLGFWTSADVEDLDPIEKLLYAYMITSPKSNMEGVYKTTMRRIAFETGIDKDMIMRISARFEAAGIGGVYNGESGVWIVASHAPQFMNSSPNVKTYFHANMADLPEEILHFMNSVGYKWPTWYDKDGAASPYQGATQGLPRGYPLEGATQGQHDTDTDTDTDTKTKTDTVLTGADGEGRQSTEFSELSNLYIQVTGSMLSPDDYQIARFLSERFSPEVIRYELEKASGKRHPLKYIHAYMAKPGYEPPVAEASEAKRAAKREEFVATEIDPDFLELARRANRGPVAEPVEEHTPEPVEVEAW